jgi:hypothetical protein
LVPLNANDTPEEMQTFMRVAWPSCRRAQKEGRHISGLTYCQASDIAKQMDEAAGE